MKQKNDAGLKKVLTKWELLAIGVGAVIGWSWVVYAGPWTSYPGTLGGIIAFILGGLLCTFIGLAYAELSSALPFAGGDMVFTFEGLNQKWAFVSGVCIVVTFMGLVIVETIMLPVILESLGFPIPKAGRLFDMAGEPVYLTYVVISVFVNGFFAFLNYRGVALSGVFQTISVVILVIAALFFVISGVSLGNMSNAAPLITGVAGISIVMLMVPAFMGGFNTIAQVAEEAQVEPQIIGKLVLTTVWACVLFYIFIIIGLSFSAPEAARSGKGVVVLDAVGVLFNSNAARSFVAFAALLGMLTSWNAAYLAASRVLYALAKIEFMPRSLGSLNSSLGTPSTAIFVIFLLSSCFALLGTSQAIFMGIINVVGFCLLLSWMLVSFSFVRLRTSQPDLPRPYKAVGGKTTGVIAIVLSFIFLLLYTPLNPMGGLTKAELAGLGLIVLTGFVIYFTNVRNGSLSEEERRHIIKNEL